MIELKQWFLEKGRDLPWRENPEPYTVWVSEVMLQQTRAVVVIPYFLQWMKRFPTVRHLAEADIEEVIKLWEGLGYYSRARNLHAGAKKVVEDFGGIIPAGAEQLASIKGLGPYTIAAIQSFAFHIKAAPVDGNVLRVLARYFAINDDVMKQKTQKLIREKMLAELPDKDPHLIAEALIELGATLCGKKPSCSRCPLQSRCLAHAQNRELELPFKLPKQRSIPLERTVGICRADESVLVRKCSSGEIMEGLHEFPYLEGNHPPEALAAHLQLPINAVSSTKTVRHTFTKYRAVLFPYVIKTLKNEVPGYFWASDKEVEHLSFSSGHRRILHSFLSMSFTYL